MPALRKLGSWLLYYLIAYMPRHWIPYVRDSFAEALKLPALLHTKLVPSAETSPNAAIKTESLSKIMVADLVRKAEKRAMGFDGLNKGHRDYQGVQA